LNVITILITVVREVIRELNVVS